MSDESPQRILLWVEAETVERPSRQKPHAAMPRRSAFRIMFVGLATAALVPLQWIYTKSRASAAGPTSEYTSANCSPPYTSGYTEMTNSYGSPAVKACLGGTRRSDKLCSGGFHREGVFAPVSSETFRSARISTACGGGSYPARNAWRWTASNGALYRCSDAWSTITQVPGGGSITALTIGVCKI